MPVSGPWRNGESSRMHSVLSRPMVVSARADESLAPLLERATSHLGTRLTLDHLAERAGLSSRTLARRFTEQLGSPGQWLLGQRLYAARILLEQTDLPVEAIATRVGLASAVNLRRRFRVHLGTYRRTFSET
jgi:AraC family transcriptional regulator, transcriptional activator FtrA